MAPPTESKSVNIDPAHFLYLENYLGVDPQLLPHSREMQNYARDLSQALAGSDLSFDPFHQNFETLIQGKTHVLSIESEMGWVKALLAADTDGDRTLSLVEAEAARVSDPAGPFSRHADAGQLLREVERRIEERYWPIAQNMMRLSLQTGFKPTLDALKAYSHGLLVEDLRQANSFLMPNKLGKIVGNIGLFLQVAAWNFSTRWTGEKELPTFFMNEVANTAAFSDMQKRNQAINALEAVVRSGARRGDEWVYQLDLEMALRIMQDRGDGESATLLQEDFPTRQLHEILSQEDPAKIYRDLKKFAEAERPQFLGIFGGGNTRNPDWLNGSGTRNNFYFADSIFHMLMRVSPDKGFRSEVGKVRMDMRGENGSFAETLWSWWPGNENKDWGDVYTQDFLGRSINLGLAFYIGPKALKGIKDIQTLEHSLSPMGILTVMNSWYRGIRWYNPLTWRHALNPFRGMGKLRPNLRKTTLLGGGREAAESVNQAGNFGISRWGGFPFNYTKRAADWFNHRVLGIAPGKHLWDDAAEQMKLAGTKVGEVNAFRVFGKGFIFTISVLFYLSVTEKAFLPEEQEKKQLGPVPEEELPREEHGASFYNPFDIDYQLDLVPWDHHKRGQPGLESGE